MHSQELQWVQEARDTFLATKADFFKRFEEAPDLTDDLIGLRETTFKNFDQPDRDCALQDRQRRWANKCDGS